MTKKGKSYLQENTDTGLLSVHRVFQLTGKSISLASSPPFFTTSYNPNANVTPFPHQAWVWTCVPPSSLRGHKALGLWSLAQLARAFRTQHPCAPRSLVEPPSTAVIHCRCKLFSTGHNYSNNQMKEYREGDIELEQRFYASLIHLLTHHYNNLTKKVGGGGRGD